MRKIIACLCCMVFWSGVIANGATPATQSVSRPSTVPISLFAAHFLFKTKLTESIQSGVPIATPPPNVFTLVKYKSAVGDLAAYLTPDPHDNRKHPAIIWITGGDCNTIGNVWSPGRPENDQSAEQYRSAGIVMMFASLRGGNQNPGMEEKFFGEVMDIDAAGAFLAKQSWVEPQRIYLGGHSTGGTLALLTSESLDRFRAVFCFGPVAAVTQYSTTIDLPFDTTIKNEVAVRSPDRWLNYIKKPTFVFEDADKPSNASSLTVMSKLKFTSPVQFHLVAGVTHFSILAPVNRLIAEKILHDDGPNSNIQITDAELAASVQSH